MKKFWQRFIQTLKKTWCWTLLLVLVWCLLVVFVGPLIAVAGKAVLADLGVRLTVCLISVLLWVIALVVSAPIRKSRRRKQLNDAELKSELQVEEQSEDEFYLLKERLNKALHIVKHASFYGKSRSSRYELPWYLLMGDSNSGKQRCWKTPALIFH